MSKIEVGVIGAGGISSTVHLPLLSYIENIKIKFIADIFEPKELAKSYHTKSIKINDITNLPNCDIVLLATPVGAREEYIREFSKREIPIFTEKPFAIDLETHKNFLKMSKKITCNYMRVYYNSTRQIKNIITSRIFGSLKKVTITEGGIIGKTGRGKDSYQANTKLSGGGILMELGCHTLSQLAFIFNNISVSKAKIIWQDDFDADVQVIFAVSDTDSFNVDYHITMLKHVESITTLFFEHSIVSFNHLLPDSIINVFDYNNEKQFTINPDNRFASTFGQAYYLKWKTFLDNLLQAQIINTEFETSLETTKMISDIIQKGSLK